MKVFGFLEARMFTRANGVTLQISSGTRNASKKLGDGKMDDINFHVAMRNKNSLAGAGIFSGTP